ncbi:hypothetical protein EVAR_38233_1 [Eumeta japonica]|uniref:Uncharacterized protein n=1 Tax=Eumeta variegata TaxID=151549 RepID=A0A4C1XE84_EUMVA|nr:hypothetical protein EVAR_38233_1 [Eumeta japonica]
MRTVMSKNEFGDDSGTEGEMETAEDRDRHREWKSERKCCPSFNRRHTARNPLTTQACTREERQPEVRAYAAIAEIAVTLSECEFGGIGNRIESETEIGMLPFCRDFYHLTVEAYLPIIVLLQVNVLGYRKRPPIGIK